MNKPFANSWRTLRTLFFSLAALVILVFAILALRPAPDGDPVWATVRTVEYGEAFTKENIHLVTLPAAATPPNALAANATVIGTISDRHLSARTVLTEADVQGTADTRQLAVGESLVDVLLPALSASVLQPGEIVDLWGQVEDCGDALCSPQLIAENCRIMRAKKADGGAWAAEESLTLSVAVPNAVTGRVLLAEHNGSLQYVLRGAPPGS